MSLNLFWAIAIVALSRVSVHAQIPDAVKDSIYIDHVENHQGPDKVLHAEPLYIDLIRDLGARRGEKEWNVGLGITDKLQFDSYEALVEYEWAPINRLGLEVELPFTFYYPSTSSAIGSIPTSQLNSLKVAAQWSFLVNENAAASMALGYINEFELSDFSSSDRPLITGNVFNPFLVVAKRWGNNFHSLLYTGPKIVHHYTSNTTVGSFEMNTSIHYMISGTRNFLGIEFNKSVDNMDFDMTIRPQIRVSVSDNTLIGIVTGIPVSRENERLSAFIRLIWEPEHKKT
jgi:hypothetical protein